MLASMDGYEVFLTSVSRNQDGGVVVYVSHCFDIQYMDVWLHLATGVEVMNLKYGGVQHAVLAVYRSPSYGLDLEHFNTDLETY